MSSSRNDDWNCVKRNSRVTQVFHFTQTNSTNDWAKQYILENRLRNGEIILVVADEQTHGRGRGNHVWWSPRGMMAISLIVAWEQLGFQRETCMELSRYVAEAVQHTVVETLAGTGLETTEYWASGTKVKPPNDILVFGKKIAGILIESPNPKYVVIGIGINLNNDISLAPHNLEEKVTSVKRLTGRNIDPPECGCRLILRILFKLNNR